MWHVRQSKAQISLCIRYCLVIIWDFLALKEAVQARLSLHFVKWKAHVPAQFYICHAF